MKKLNKENWKKEVLQSTENMKLVLPKKNLFEGVNEKIDKKHKTTLNINSFYWAAAVIFFLLNSLCIYYTVFDDNKYYSTGQSNDSIVNTYKLYD